MQDGAYLLPNMTAYTVWQQLFFACQVVMFVAE